MTAQKMRVFLEIYFKPNEELEDRIKRSVTAPFRFDGAGFLNGPRPEKNFEYVARVPAKGVPKLRRLAHTLRRFKGIKSISFAVYENIPLTKGPFGLRRT